MIKNLLKKSGKHKENSKSTQLSFNLDAIQSMKKSLLLLIYVANALISCGWTAG